jgi:hypothetical protein
MIWPPPAEQGATAFVGAPSTADNSSTGTRGWYATEAAIEIFVSARGVAPTRRKGNTIMEQLMAPPPTRPTC